MVQLVKSFYEDDEYSQIKPVKKDYVSIKKKCSQAKTYALM